MSYEKLKKWVRDNKTTLILGASFVLVFVMGFGVGRYDRENMKVAPRPLTNYSTKPAVAQTETKAEPEAAKPEVAGAAKVPGTECFIKGNISSGGKKIYHLKGGAFYDRTNAEQCFKTEAEARDAGFVKSSR